MFDAKGFDPALLTEGEANKKTELDQFWNRKVSMQFGPELVVGNVGVPRDGAGVSQRNFFSLGEFVGIGEICYFLMLPGVFQNVWHSLKYGPFD